MNTAAATAPETKMRNVNSNTQIIQVPRNGLVVPFRNDSPRDTFEIEVQNLPVEHFKGDGKAVLSFATTTGFVAALRHRGEGEVGSYLYSDQGERYDSDIQGAPFLPYLISGRSILAKLRGQGKEGLLMEQPHSLEELQVTSRFLTFTALCSNLHIPPESQEQLRGEIMSRLGKGFNTKVLGMNDIAQIAEYPFLPCYAQLISEPSRSYFTFIGDHSYTIYQTRDENGVSLQPNDWQRTVILRGKALTDEQKKNFPWLEHCTSEAKCIPDRESVRYTIDPVKGLQVFAVPSHEVLFQAQATHAITDGLGGDLYFSIKNDPAIYRITAKELGLIVEDRQRREITAERVALPRPGFVTGMNFDPRGNFLLIRARTGDSSEDLMVLDQVNLKLSAFVQNLAPEEKMARAFEVDGKGNLVYVDKEGQLRMAATGMGHINHGGLRLVVERLDKAQKAEQKELRGIEESIASLKAPEIRGSNARKITLTDLEQQLAEKLNEMFLPKIAEATSLEHLKKVRTQIEVVSEESKYQKFSGAFDTIIDKLDKKQSSMEVEGMKGQLGEVEKLLKGNPNWVEIVTASKLLEKIKAERAKTLIRDPEERNAIGGRIDVVKGEIAKLRTEQKGELEKQIEEAFTRYEKGLRQCQTALEVQQHAGSETGKLFELIEAVGREEDERRYIARVRNTTNSRRTEISAEIEALENKIREEQMDSLRQLNALRETLKLELMGMQSVLDVSSLKKHSPMVREYLNWAGRLPEGLLKHELEKLDDVFERRNHQLAAPAPSTSLGAGGTWEHLLPVYEVPKIVWSAEIKPEPDQPGMGKLLFRDNFGRQYDPEHELLPLDSSNATVLGAVEKYTPKAREFFEGVISDIPQFSEEWVINNWTEQRLVEFGKLAKQQLRGDFGILLIRSEAGVGKNMLWDIFGYLTHRNLTTFSCNSNTEVDDLTYLYQYDPKKRGTYKLNSHFIDRLSIPGSIILMDEVNTLPPGVKKILNPLFDYRRTLFLPDGRKITAHPSVIFVGLENFVSASYQGVHAHSSDLNSRARVIELDYPPFKEPGNGHFLPYEAEIYAKQLNSFRGMPSNDFARLWDAVVNNQGLTGVFAGLRSPERASDIKMVHKIVNLAHRIRELHRQNTEGGEASFVFTPREGRQIMAEVRDGSNLHDAVKGVLLPKIQDIELRKKVFALISAVIPEAAT